MRFQAVVRERDRFPYCFHGHGPREDSLRVGREAQEWAVAQFGPMGPRWHRNSSGNTFRFQDRADAAVFRLRWA